MLGDDVGFDCAEAESEDRYDIRVEVLAQRNHDAMGVRDDSTGNHIRTRRRLKGHSEVEYHVRPVYNVRYKKGSI